MGSQKEVAWASHIISPADLSKFTEQIEHLQRSVESLHAKFDAFSRRVEDAAQATSLIHSHGLRGSDRLTSRRSASSPPLNGGRIYPVSIVPDPDYQRDPAYTRLAKAHAATTFKLRQAKAALEKWQSKARTHASPYRVVGQNGHHSFDDVQTASTALPDVASSIEPAARFISTEAVRPKRSLAEGTSDSRSQERLQVKQEESDDDDRPIYTKKISLSSAIMDLDDIADALTTPRKTRQIDRASPSRQQHHEKDGQFQTSHFARDITLQTHSNSEPVNEQSCFREEDVNTNHPGAPNSPLTRPLSPKQHPVAVDTNLLAEHEGSISSVRYSGKDIQPNSRKRKALQPRDANIGAVHRSASAIQNHVLKRNCERRDTKVELLAEDGEIRQSDEEVSTKNKRLKGLLYNGLLASGPPDAMHDSSKVGKANIRRDHVEPMRPADFELDASRNHGVSYAFDNVVRGKPARECLSGCTRSDCCGPRVSRFLAVAGSAEEGRIAFDAKDRESNRDANDQHALRLYLGEAMETVMSSAAPDERKELLSRAKEKMFADKFGRHRSLQTRQRTPPGMWDTDMPNTQHLEDQRRATKAAEDERIADRRREAVGGHGRWKLKEKQ